MVTCDVGQGFSEIYVYSLNDVQFGKSSSEDLHNMFGGKFKYRQSIPLQHSDSHSWCIERCRFNILISHSRCINRLTFQRNKLVQIVSGVSSWTLLQFFGCLSLASHYKLFDFSVFDLMPMLSCFFKFSANISWLQISCSKIFVQKMEINEITFHGKLQ